jgi:hypothetical protein
MVVKPLLYIGFSASPAKWGADIERLDLRHKSEQ